MISEDDHKILARQRRAATLRYIKDGQDFSTRTHQPSTAYRRKPKYVPKDLESWDEAFD